jgi:hypothetical protein
VDVPFALGIEAASSPVVGQAFFLFQKKDIVYSPSERPKN